MEGRNTPSSKLTILISLTAVFPVLLSLLLQDGGVPWGGNFRPQDQVTFDMIGTQPLAYFANHRYTLQPWAELSLHIGWTMVSIGVLYGLFVWCQFGTRERQRKISTFMAVVVSVVTVLLFVFTTYLSVHSLMMLRNVPDFRLFHPSYKENTFELFSRVWSLQKILTQNIWYKVQIVFQCCGFYSYTDWTKIERDVVPDSCCRIYEAGCGRNFSMENIYGGGCEEKFTEHIKQQYIIQTQDEQIFYLLVSIVFSVAAILITFFSVKAWCSCEKNNNRENDYLLVNNGDNDLEHLDLEAENPEDRLVYMLKTNQYKNAFQ